MMAHSRFVAGALLLSLGGITAAACGEDETGDGSPCPPGFLVCGDVCANPNDEETCGACDVTCTDRHQCIQSACACVDGVELECDGVCRDRYADPNHCGGCNQACGLDQYCRSGVCEDIGCDSRCDGECTDLGDDHEHCGDCETPCAEDEVCYAGACTSDCPIPYLSCDGGCALVDFDDDNCGACGVACDTEGGETCDLGECVDRCAVLGQTWCGVTCVDIDASRTNCGACGVTCQIGDPCVDGECIPSCNALEIRCDGECVDIDEEHCGDCDTACFEGATCEWDGFEPACHSVCDGLPGVDVQLCDGDCIDLDASPDHCGDCDTVCTQGDCVDGACTCPPEDQCDGVCVQLGSDPDHCGVCETACAPGQACIDGTCACTGDDELCDSGCADLDTDEDNCGACDFPCDPGQACNDGICDCPEGETSCDGTCKDLASDEANCGSCGAICPPTLSCLDGTCGPELTCEQNFTEPTGCAVFPVQADACGTPVLVETTQWASADISTTLFFTPSSPWQRDELIRISGETDAPDACCGGGVVSLGFETAEARLQTWTQFLSPNNGFSHATPSIEEIGSAFECSQPADAFFGATGNFNFAVERFAMSGDFNGGGVDLASAVPLAVDGDGEVCAQVCGVHKAQCLNEARQFYRATIPPHRALAIDYGARGGVIESLEVYRPTGEFVCHGVGAVVGQPGYVFYGARISNHTNLPREVVLAPTANSGSSYFNIAVALEDDLIP